jgi:uncharacterized protein YukE
VKLQITLELYWACEQVLTYTSGRCILAGIPKSRFTISVSRATFTVLIVSTKAWKEADMSDDMSKKEAYEKKIQGQLDELGADIDKLKARAESAEGDTQLEYYKQVEDLSAKQEAANEKLEEVRKAGGEGWKDLKEGLDSAWDSLSRSVKSAASRFK